MAAYVPARTSEEEEEEEVISESVSRVFICGNVALLRSAPRVSIHPLFPRRYSYSHRWHSSRYPRAIFPIASPRFLLFSRCRSLTELHLLESSGNRVAGIPPGIPLLGKLATPDMEISPSSNFIAVERMAKKEKKEREKEKGKGKDGKSIAEERPRRW